VLLWRAREPTSKVKNYTKVEHQRYGDMLLRKTEQQKPNNSVRFSAIFFHSLFLLILIVVGVPVWLVSPGAWLRYLRTARRAPCVLVDRTLSSNGPPPRNQAGY